MKRYYKKESTPTSSHRIATKDDFYTEHIGFPQYYFPHLGMKYMVRDDDKYVELKLNKHTVYDTDIMPYIKTREVLVSNAEVQYYHKRLTAFGNHLLYKKVMNDGTCF